MGDTSSWVQIFMLKKEQEKAKEKHIFLRKSLFLYHHINVKKLIKTINNQKIGGKVEELVPTGVG